MSTQTVELWTLIVENFFTVVTTSFVGLFMIIIAWFMIKGMKQLNLTSLYLEDGTVSSTKFWSSVAYFIATVAFLAINILNPASAALEFVWAIYLATVAGHATFSKFISKKYAIAQETRQERFPVQYGPYYDDPQPPRGRRRSRRREEWHDESEEGGYDDPPPNMSDEQLLRQQLNAGAES